MKEFSLLQDGCILANAGHLNMEIDVLALRRSATRTVRPMVEEIDLGGRTVYLLAGGAMLNLATNHPASSPGAPPDLAGPDGTWRAAGAPR